MIRIRTLPAMLHDHLFQLSIQSFNQIAQDDMVTKELSVLIN